MIYEQTKANKSVPDICSQSLPRESPASGPVETCRMCFMAQAWLRELVWRTEDLPQLRRNMIEALPEFKGMLVKEPMFCYDAAAKLLVWSDLVYTFEDNLHADEVR